MNLLGRCTRLLRPITQVPKRLSHDEIKVYYRDHTHYDEKSERTFRYCSTIFWAWVCYHFINNYQMLLGGQPYPARESFTDEELGLKDY
ncbi:unnamed protein product [Hymenolepis diminuta]|uniref:Transposase n=1 Tax=Hymenolepis diminuta TaxID=6216 RepID=A0A0R3SE27_HYMDI|nr:unnamed protein product [Hymenolepis diminuta]VUZ43268.1 unnamed protein product [Hymenolepis diminuta]